MTALQISKIMEREKCEEIKKRLEESASKAKDDSIKKAIADKINVITKPVTK
jgi:hypothetical protein